MQRSNVRIESLEVSKGSIMFSGRKRKHHNSSFAATRKGKHWQQGWAGHFWNDAWNCPCWAHNPIFVQFEKLSGNRSAIAPHKIPVLSRVGFQPGQFTLGIPQVPSDFANQSHLTTTHHLRFKISNWTGMLQDANKAQCYFYAGPTTCQRKCSTQTSTNLKIITHWVSNPQPKSHCWKAYSVISFRQKQKPLFAKLNQLLLGPRRREEMSLAGIKAGLFLENSCWDCTSEDSPFCQRKSLFISRESGAIESTTINVSNPTD